MALRSKCTCTCTPVGALMAAVTSRLLTVVKTGITIVSYFGNVTTSLFTSLFWCTFQIKRDLLLNFLEQSIDLSAMQYIAFVSAV